MKIQKKTLLIYLLIILSIIFSSFIWEFIELPYKDPKIIGVYSINEFNANNDIIRYLIFVLFPVFTFIFFKIFYEKISFTNFLQEIKKKSESILTYDIFCKISFITILIFLLLEFSSFNFPIYNLDLVHGGQILSSAYRSSLDNSLWSGSYVTVGIFFETLNSKFIWSIFNKESIGLSRIPELLFILISKILLIILIFKTTIFLKLNSFYRNIFFIFNSLIVINFLDYDISSADSISYRELPIIVLTILFIDYLQNKNNKNINLILFGILSVIVFFWGIDRGLVLNLLVLCLLFFFILRNEYQKFLIVLSSIIFSWIVTYFLLGDEFNSFISNTFSIYKNMSYIHGLIHPTPFSDDPNSYRATKTLITISLTLLISINLFFGKKKLFTPEFKQFLLFLSIISFLSYAYVIGRSDGPHIKNIFGYPLLFLSIYFSYLLLRFIEKKTDNYINLNTKKILNISFLILILFSFSLNINNILNYNERFIKYINLDDNKFLKEKDILFISQTKKLLNDYDCIQLFSNDVALLYLLKKKSCTKYYFVWSAAASNTQIKMINDLKNANLIIKGGPSYNWDIPLDKKLNLVNEYISKNFKELKTIDSWSILTRK